VRLRGSCTDLGVEDVGNALAQKRPKDLEQRAEEADRQLGKQGVDLARRHGGALIELPFGNVESIGVCG
jgi:hypothetical protein